MRNGRCTSSSHQLFKTSITLSSLSSWTYAELSTACSSSGSLRWGWKAMSNTSLYIVYFEYIEINLWYKHNVLSWISEGFFYDTNIRLHRELVKDLDSDGVYMVWGVRYVIFKNLFFLIFTEMQLQLCNGH